MTTMKELSSDPAGVVFRVPARLGASASPPGTMSFDAHNTAGSIREKGSVVRGILRLYRENMEPSNLPRGLKKLSIRTAELDSKPLVDTGLTAGSQRELEELYGADAGALARDHGVEVSPCHLLGFDHRVR